MKVEKFLSSTYRPDQVGEEEEAGGEEKEDTWLSLAEMAVEAKHRHFAEIVEKRERWLEAGEEEEEEDERAAAVVVLRLAKKSATSQACHVEILTLTL